MDPELPNLHDAVLEGIEVSWGSATASIRLVVAGDPPLEVALMFAGIREIHVPHDQPWGPSVFVNEVDHTDSDDKSGVSMRIQMQSGDEIRVHAASLEIA